MRNDIHSPTNFDPASYVYVGSFDQWPEAGAFVSQTRSEYKTDFGVVDAFTYDHAEYLGGKKLMQELGKRPSGGRFLSKEFANVAALIGQCHMAEKVAQ